MTPEADALAAAMARYRRQGMHSCSVLHIDAHGNPIPCPDGPRNEAIMLLAALTESGYSLVPTARYLDLDDPASVERLAVALHGSYLRDPAMPRIHYADLNDAERGMWKRHAKTILAALRGTP